MTEIYRLTEQGEGRVSHMYLDTNGFVTVAVGNMLRDEEAACALPFRRNSGQAASPGEIAAEYRSVRALPKGKVARWYRAYTTLQLNDAAITDLFNDRLVEFENGLRKYFPAFDGYPIPARQGLMDMAFNLGVVGLVTKFPTFTKAAQDKNWAICAAECQRQGISASRNEEVKILFESIEGNADA